MDTISIIANILRKQIAKMQGETSIVSVYLFGSFLSGNAKKRSDIDLAFLLDEKVYKSSPIITMAPPHLIAA
jgi:predicted nucleotidyltransferase